MDEPANRAEVDLNVSEVKGQKRAEPPKYF